MEQGKSNCTWSQISVHTWKYSTYHRNNIYNTSEYLQIYPIFFLSWNALNMSKWKERDVKCFIILKLINWPFNYMKYKLAKWNSVIHVFQHDMTKLQQIIIILDEM